MLSVIIPTYNERANVPILIERLAIVCKKNFIKYEIIFVDDNSPDGTGAYLEGFSKNKKNLVRVLNRPKKTGLGSAILDGVKIAKGDYICIMDSDLQHRPEDLPRLFKERHAAGIVLGSRFVKGGGNEGLGFFRLFMSRVASFMAKLVLGIDLKDPQSGFAVIKSDLFRKYSIDPKGFKIILAIIYRSNAVVKEVPITFQRRFYGESKLGFMEILKYIELLFSLRFGV